MKITSVWNCISCWCYSLRKPTYCLRSRVPNISFFLQLPQNTTQSQVNVSLRLTSKQLAKRRLQPIESLATVSPEDNLGGLSQQNGENHQLSHLFLAFLLLWQSTVKTLGVFHLLFSFLFVQEIIHHSSTTAFSSLMSCICMLVPSSQSSIKCSRNLKSHKDLLLLKQFQADILWVLGLTTRSIGNCIEMERPLRSQ